ncbi:enoyl-CoA hydratase/isomerase family protein [Variovorax guangxiensis]|uniref:enoyl-CoA hydratase/isomerase family protein n=1 Tax=Variovorax guangxiensis TaxID=1775474 RepID=UPI0028636570|nr:enoyl-CoA hydratase/isomerase family protein [Variovorax guangxiensis]MDR6855134.1 enoyl-CoA hydratase/carnithine racemase [Variovorax guangxiensis]
MRQGAVRLEREGAVAFVTLANPGRLNAMSRAMWRALRAVFDGELARDASLRCVIVRGEAGQFCAGGDISEYPSFRFDEALLREFHENEVWAALAAMRACELPLVAQIEGACMGAGLEIASCCDIRLAGESAKFGAPIAKLGFPMAPREAALVRGAVGDALARDMLLAASVHGAQRLYAAGFLLAVLPDAEVASRALAHAARIAELAPKAARANKRTLAAASAESLLATAYDYADSPEHREGIAAFLAKRPPVF